jgi:hypothetical protein
MAETGAGLMFLKTLRFVLGGAALIAAASLAACAGRPPPPPPPPPPAPPVPPAISLSTTIIGDAAVFEGHLAKIAAISPNFTSGQDVAQAIRQGSTLPPDQMLRGEIAYAAIAALQDPNFVANVRAFAADPQTREQISAQLVRDPDYVVALTGSNTAAALAMSAILGQGRKAYDAGVLVRQAAYDVQHQPWSKEAVVDRPQRLIDAKSVGQLTSTAAMDDVGRLRDAAMGQSPIPLHAPAATPPYPPVIVRGLAVAALAALGEAGDENLVAMAPMLRDGPSLTCMTTDQLNLYQCLAVARPHYEDMFCLGQYGMIDTAQCTMIAAGAPAPVVVAPPPPAEPAKAHAGRGHRRHHGAAKTPKGR